MKVTAKQYATALFEALEEKNKEEAKEIVKKTAAMIIKNGDQAKVGGIIERYIALSNIAEGVVEAEFVSARELPHDTASWLEDHLKKAIGADKLVISQRIDETILGGVIIRYGDKVIDASLKSRIEQLKSNLIK